MYRGLKCVFINYRSVDWKSNNMLNQPKKINAISTKLTMMIFSPWSLVPPLF
jgi:hypothetical protein